MRCRSITPDSRQGSSLGVKTKTAYSSGQDSTHELKQISNDCDIIPETALNTMDAQIAEWESDHSFDWGSDTHEILDEQEHILAYDPEALDDQLDEPKSNQYFMKQGRLHRNC